jgi:hypothetical protein
LVDAKGAAARRAVTSIGGGLAATAADLKIGTGNLREKVRFVLVCFCVCALGLRVLAPATCIYQ